MYYVNRIKIQSNRNRILCKFNDKLRSRKQQYITTQKHRNLLVNKLRLIIKMQRKSEELMQVLQALFVYFNGECWLDTVTLQANQLTAKFKAKNHDVGDSVAKIFSHLGFLTRPKINMSTDDGSDISFTVNSFLKQEK